MTHKKIIILLILFVSILFLENTQIYKKIFILVSKDPERRLIDQHGYCGAESVGFIRFLLKKYEFNQVPRVINFDNMVPDNYWSFFKFDKNIRENKFNNDYVILLNFNVKDEKNLKLLKKSKIDLNNYTFIETYENCFLIKIS